MQHLQTKTPIGDTKAEMSSSQVICYVNILKKSKRGNIFCSLRSDELQINTRKNYRKATSRDILK
jgi:hypothetical protein